MRRKSNEEKNQLRQWKILGVGFASIVSLILFLSWNTNSEILYQSTNPKYNPIFVVECGNRMVCLKFDSVDSWRQSAIMVGNPDWIEIVYVRLMLSSLMFVSHLERSLVIGLGGGSMPNYIRHHYPQSKVDVVEINGELVPLQKKYFGFDIDDEEHVSVHVQDGEEYVTKCEKKYDLIIVDGGSLMSATIEGLKKLRNILKEDGVVAFNGFYEEDYNHVKIRNIQTVFEHVFVLESTSVNTIFIATMKEVSIGKNELKERAKRVQQKLKTSVNFEGIISATDSTTHVSVLKGWGNQLQM
eukprot:TRINITY_DN9199_c0_g1_i1.p1 TRINITY_DN9199_c0_g1~~TRINITY_DN9199_c0_g1_i1.p1  ORF type:complete len:318 (-),score=70.08 TRINITY_DN9199_c0_g1_i1:73-969(-)